MRGSETLDYIIVFCIEITIWFSTRVSLGKCEEVDSGSTVGLHFHETASMETPVDEII